MSAFLLQSLEIVPAAMTMQQFGHCYRTARDVSVIFNIFANFSRRR